MALTIANDRAADGHDECEEHTMETEACQSCGDWSAQAALPPGGEEV